MEDLHVRAEPLDVLGIYRRQQVICVGVHRYDAGGPPAPSDNPRTRANRRSCGICAAARANALSGRTLGDPLSPDSPTTYGMSWYMCPVISMARPSPGDGWGISGPSDHLEISRSVRPSGSSSPDIADAKGSSRGIGQPVILKLQTPPSRAGYWSDKAKWADHPSGPHVRTGTLQPDKGAGVDDPRPRRIQEA